ncbi:DNAJ heat shock N-terminal domain-containing protein [Seminavis robusta]|uniref:DNAJ heat shock N-terminal domain-containing protein n=1 Tax=Seminavis robusta TaxID=568900 RepID=A0A9N8HP19_9STRA|nr:DNAJ heat shock N-terminal domain-containing protein [Seminavis robusta]|eukprot:Sro1136_g245220.1 DNAJ heat shock N-terminal domain-containing protein (434) ;mRNA; f:25171-27003
MISFGAGPCWKAVLATLLVQGSTIRAFVPLSPVAGLHRRGPAIKKTAIIVFSDWNDSSQDSNNWSSSDDAGTDAQEDWEDLLNRKNNGSFWSEFESSEDNAVSLDINADQVEEVDESDAWLETLASLQAEEVEFNMKEADRADKVRQMQEWGFDSSTIESTLDVSMDSSLEEKDEVDGMKLFREESYWDEEDMSLVESHTKVAKDPDTGETMRSQMVYVDEHTCIGCTNCAMIAQSTFFMQDDHGRARVFEQWGDDDETIKIAIETCPVDCIHYVPYDELVRLEIERRDQNINAKARLVSQAEYSGAGPTSGPVKFTEAPRISGNMAARCNNCPSRGCRTCPMYGVGLNPEFQRKEKERKARAAKRRLERERESDMKSADFAIFSFDTRLAERTGAVFQSLYYYQLTGEKDAGYLMVSLIRQAIKLRRTQPEL